MPFGVVKMALETEERNLPSNEVSVSLECGDLKAKFSGTAESVNRSVNSFLAKEVPAFALARRLMLKYSTVELVENFVDIVKITPEGPALMVGDRKLSDRQLIALRLVGQQIAYETGNTVSNSMSLSDLQESIALNPKTISSRLSELSKLGSVAKENVGGSSSFRITTMGVSTLLENLNKNTRKESKIPQ